MEFNASEVLSLLLNYSNTPCFWIGEIRLKDKKNLLLIPVVKSSKFDCKLVKQTMTSRTL